MFWFALHQWENNLIQSPFGFPRSIDSGDRIFWLFFLTLLCPAKVTEGLVYVQGLITLTLSPAEALATFCLFAVSLKIPTKEVEMEEKTILYSHTP
jgi:hypothetical protein